MCGYWPHEFVVSLAVLIVAGSLSQARGHLGESFDAALVDYDLPDGKGDVIVRALRRADPDVPIVAISSHAEGNAALRAAGADETCAKADFEHIGDVLAATATAGRR